MKESTKREIVAWGATVLFGVAWLSLPARAILGYPVHAQAAPTSPVPDHLYTCTVVRVIDGDTVVMDIHVGMQITLDDQHVRLWGIDTPEIRGAERPQGLISKAFVDDLLPPGKQLVIDTHGDTYGKYGRPIATLWVDGTNLNETLVENNLAVEATYR